VPSSVSAPSLKRKVYFINVEKAFARMNIRQSCDERMISWALVEFQGVDALALGEGCWKMIVSGEVVGEESLKVVHRSRI
jgi:hypothetical protein